MSHGKTITLAFFGILCMGTHCGPHPSERREEEALEALEEVQLKQAASLGRRHETGFNISNQTGLEVKVSSFYGADCLLYGKNYALIDLISVDNTAHGLHHTPTTLRPGDVIPFDRSAFKRQCTSSTLEVGDRIVNVLAQPHATGVFELGIATDGSVTIKGSGVQVISDTHRSAVDKIAMCDAGKSHRSIWYELVDGTWHVDGIESTPDGCMNVGLSSLHADHPFERTWSYCGPQDAWLFSRGDTLTFSSGAGALTISAKDGRWLRFRERHDDKGQELVPLDRACLHFEKGCVDVRQVAAVHLPGAPSSLEQGRWLKTTREVDGKTQEVRTFIGEARALDAG